MNIITLLTDFGTKDGYVAQMKGVISGLTDARLIDITHDITPQHLREAAFILRSTAPYFPPGTVHMAVVDPGVGTNRRGLVITTRSQILIGPDNGMLLPTAHFLGEFTVYQISHTGNLPSMVSHTFHGRDVFAPVAASIVKGMPFAQIGPRITDFVDLQFLNAEHQGEVIVGKILYVDRFGNLITNIPRQLLPQDVPPNAVISLMYFDQQRSVRLVPSYGFVKKGELLATIGSSNYLEISVNQGSAAQTLLLKEDDEIRIRLG